MPEKIQKIDHIGIVVPDLEAAIQIYTALFGVGPTSVEEVADQKVRAAFFQAGESQIELLCPTAPDSPISGWLAKRGGGIHHLCLSVPDIERALAALAALGMPLIDSAPRIGAHGKRIAFVHPKGLGGVLLELSEDPRSGCGTHPRGPHAGSTGARS